MLQVPTTNWSKNKIVRAALIAVAVVAVIALVLFSEQIGQLLEFFGLRAAVELDHSPGNITLMAGDDVALTSPFSNGFAFGDLEFDIDGNLILTPPS